MCLHICIGMCVRACRAVIDGQSGMRGWKRGDEIKTHNLPHTRRKNSSPSLADLHTGTLHSSHSYKGSLSRHLMYTDVIQEKRRKEKRECASEVSSCLLSSLPLFLFHPLPFSLSLSLLSLSPFLSIPALNLKVASLPYLSFRSGGLHSR